MKTEEIFLNAIAEELKTQSGFNIREEVFFPLRYAKNRPVTVQHTTIAKDDMPKDDRLGKGDYVTSIGTTSQNVVQAMVNKYKAEMEMVKDEVNIDILVNGQQGQRGTWREAYNWLWQHKYPRWLEAHSWELLREKATSPANWIQFLTNEEMASAKRGPKPISRPASAQKVPSTIPVNEPLSMVVDLPYPNYQLLLFNRSDQGQYLLCPSLSFAPKGLIDKPPILLPQKDSWADENQESFTFEGLCEEEFLAIALEKPLNLDWLVPRDEDSLPECTGSRFKELFEQLERQDQYHIFYQSFEVVELDNP